MNMFAPRPPLEFKAPLEKRKMPAYTGIAEVKASTGECAGGRIAGLAAAFLLPIPLADFGVRSLVFMSLTCVCMQYVARMKSTEVPIAPVLPTKAEVKAKTKAKKEKIFADKRKRQIAKCEWRKKRTGTDSGERRLLPFEFHCASVAH